MTTPYDIASELKPRDVAAYLVTTGWELDQTRGQAAEIWRHQDDGARVLLPLDPTYDDYVLRMSETLRYLSAAHEYTLQQLATSVLQTRADIIYVRADQTSLDGSIPLRQAESLVGGAVDLLEAAALATVQPRAVYAGRRPEAVRSFLDEDLRMGHTQRGSFIITLFARLGDETEQEVPLPRDEPAHAAVTETAASTSARDGDTGAMQEERLPLRTDEPRSAARPGGTRTVRIPTFQRRVTTTLAAGLESAARIAADPELAGLVAGVARGANSNLYAALQSMTQYEGLGALDLSFSWAPAVPQLNDVESTIIFGHEETRRLESARDQLRAKPSIVQDSITGQVVRLERGADKDEGVVMIAGVTGEGKTRNVRLNLTGSDYAAAVRSHERRTPVTCSGQIERKGVGYWMRNPVFTVVPR